MSQQSGSGRSCSDDSTESQSGSSSKPKMDFGKKHRKIVRILTVIAYIISVSTAAVLLSAYYVFLWKPAAPGTPTETPTTAAMARLMQTQSPSSHASLSKYSSFALPASQYVDMNNRYHTTKARKTMYHYGKTNYPQIPTPQALMMQQQHYQGSSSSSSSSSHSNKYLLPSETTTPLPSSHNNMKRSTGMLPQIDPTNKANENSNTTPPPMTNTMTPTAPVLFGKAASFKRPSHAQPTGSFGY